MSESINKRTDELTAAPRNKLKKGGSLKDRANSQPSNPMKASDVWDINQNSVKPPMKPELKKSSITVTGSTRIVLNALVMLDKAETIDDLVANVFSDYVDNELTANEKQEFDMIIERLRGKLNK